ncbi:MAG TPA: anthranilate synthase component I family protein [Syntrophomonadaceae bacterium]|nr:anthranilate synthase component I family protein [Syntrophomonadaceae bacterium]
MLIYPLEFKEELYFIYSRLNRDGYSFCLDSSLVNQELGRFSFVGINPRLVFRSQGNIIEYMEGGKWEVKQGNPLEFLNNLIKENIIPAEKLTNYPFPFAGGLVGYLSYELKNQIEDRPILKNNFATTYDQYWGLYDIFLVEDGISKQKWIVGNSKREIDSLIKEVGECLVAKVSDEEYTYIGELQSDTDQSSYIEKIKEVKEYIRKGDIDLINLSQCFSFEIEGSNLNFYKVLRHISPSYYGAFLHFPDHDIISISPERLIKVIDNIIETRPIKGTRPRGRDEREDRKNRKELEECEKEKAELLMVVESECKNLNKISIPESTVVSDLFNISEYATIFHLDATITSKLKPNITYEEILRTIFPGSSIAGIPKIRAMEIIEELEPTSRGVYTGSIGYIDFRGNCDLNVAIRTAVIKDGMGYYQAGGGLTIDSDPEFEYQETWDKTKSLILAREEVNRYAQHIFRDKT